MSIISALKAQADKSLFPLCRITRSLRRARMHLIEEDQLLPQLSHASRFNARRSFLIMLRDRGREHADLWLKKNYHRLGTRSTFDITTRFAQ